MSRIIESFFSLLLGASNFFDSLRARRHDNPVLAEYKAKQRACLTSLLPFIALILVGWATNTILTALDGFSGAQVPVAAARHWVSLAGYIVAALSALYAAGTWWDLYRFIQKHGRN